MKQQLQTLLQQAIAPLISDGTLSSTPQIQIERTKDRKFGDFASNIALTLAKQAKSKPRDLAEKIQANLAESILVSKTEIAGPGFINFYLSDAAFQSTINSIHQAADQYGTHQIGADALIQVEYVSANPTGPLHVGHGRGAAYGSSVANLLKAIGFRVQQEYYVNDAGRQMDILATSVWLRYLELSGEKITFPSNGYQGDYVWDIGAELHRTRSDAFFQPITSIMQNVRADEPQGGDKEAHIDDLIQRAKKLLGETLYREVFDLGLHRILCNIRKDLKEFGIEYDEWFSERTLTESGAVDRAITKLKEQDKIYEKNGALWFRSTDYKDEKDRVVVRDNGQATYFASDIAYHMNKFERGFSTVINVWGADHHGYVPRVKASIKAMGDDPDKLKVLLVQFASLYQGGEKVQMSTRSGEFITLRELREDVGNDAARFFYVMRKSEQHMDFDMDLAKSKTKDNPIYYLQYAHARICSVYRKMEQSSLTIDHENGLAQTKLLTEPMERALLYTSSRYPETVEDAALHYEPHQLAHYLKDLATDLHSYYDSDNKRIRVLVDDKNCRDARIALLQATRQVLKNGLQLLGVSAPEQM